MPRPRFSVLSLLLITAGAAAQLAMPIALHQYIYRQRPGWRESLLPFIAVLAWCAISFWLQHKASTSSRVFMAGWLAGVLIECGACYLWFANGWVTYDPSGWLPDGWFPCTFPVNRALVQFNLLNLVTLDRIRIAIPAIIGGMLVTGFVVGSLALLIFKALRWRMKQRLGSDAATSNPDYIATAKAILLLAAVAAPTFAAYSFNVWLGPWNLY